MLAPLIALLPSFEMGFWLGCLNLRKRAKDKTQALLLYGRPQATAIPVVDAKLKNWAGTPTPNQARAARWIVAGSRKLVNTKAFEHAVTGGIRRAWPGHGKIDTDVRLCL